MSILSSMTIEELIEEFDELGDWADQCEVLIDLGRELPPMSDELKTAENQVHGCQSMVWMDARLTDEQPRVIELVADSDAMIVKGLLSVILMLFSGKTADEILATDIQDVFRRLGLTRHLSTARRNGLSGMVERVRRIARESLS